MSDQSQCPEMRETQERDARVLEELRDFLGDPVGAPYRPHVWLRAITAVITERDRLRERVRLLESASSLGTFESLTFDDDDDLEDPRP